jgi:hypothetical protein
MLGTGELCSIASKTAKSDARKRAGGFDLIGVERIPEFDELRKEHSQTSSNRAFFACPTSNLKMNGNCPEG